MDTTRCPDCAIATRGSRVLGEVPRGPSRSQSCEEIAAARPCETRRIPLRAVRGSRVSQRAGRGVFVTGNALRERGRLSPTLVQKVGAPVVLGRGRGVLWLFGPHRLGSVGGCCVASGDYVFWAIDFKTPWTRFRRVGAANCLESRCPTGLLACWLACRITFPAPAYQACFQRIVAWAEGILMSSRRWGDPTN